MTDKSTPETLIDHLFHHVFPKYGYNVRPSQVRLTKHMASILSHHQISLSEAEVGTGKTFAYLIACIVNSLFIPEDFRARMNYAHAYHFTMETRMPYIITTSSIELQKALMNDYIPRLSKILMKEGIIKTPITAALRKGKSNYVCKRRLNKYLHTLKGTNKDIERIIATTSSSIDLDMADSLSSYDKKQICVLNCPKTCKHRAMCRYIALQENLKSPDHFFQVCNHNYFIADLTHRKNRLPNLLPNYRGVIIDEAHKFSNALSQMQTFELNLTDTKRIIDKLKSQDPEQTKLINITAFQLSFIAKRLATLPIDEVIAFDLQTKHLIKQLYGALHDLNQTVDQSDLRDAEQTLEHITAHEERIFWLTEDTIHSVSKYPGRIIKHVVYDKTLPVILTSGTLSIDGDFHYFKRELGLQSVSAFKLKTTSERSPYNLKEQCQVYISEATLPPEPNNPEYLTSIASEIIKLINHTNGRALILFTSYKSMRQVYDLISGKTAYPIIMASRGTRNAIEQFKKTRDAVLLSTSAWEGVDIQGEQLSSVIIVKLPFLVPDLLSEEKRKQYKDQKTYRDAVLIPNMLIKLRQGIGRLIRHEDDKGLISILDSRVGNSSAYRVHVNNILPACAIINELAFDGFSCKNHNANASTIGWKG